MPHWEDLVKRIGVPEWPYPVRYGEEKEVSADVLVLGGGVAGCFAAISAARKGLKVALVDKSATIHSGAAGAGIDHWQYAATNPRSKLTPEELVQALTENNGGWICGAQRYIQCMESYDTLLELEKMGMKIRDTEDEFKGAPFRDEETKLLFAYDYENNTAIRIWGSGMKPALYGECKRLGVQIYDRVMATSLLTEGGKQGARVVGATGIGVRTGEFFVFQAKATVLAMGLPGRLWFHSTEHQGLYAFHTPNLTGDGRAMGWRAGAEFTMMEKSSPMRLRGFNSFGVVPFAVGSPTATWYPCTIVDAKGQEVPWVNFKGEVIPFKQRTIPAPGQRHFLHSSAASGMGAGPPELKQPRVDFEKGKFVEPFYADLPSMPEDERRVIFGLMVSQEGKSWIGYRKLTEAGFDPNKDLLQMYPPVRGAFGWRAFRLPPGGILADWDLKTSLEGLYAAGEQLFTGGACAHSGVTGRYAGKKAAGYALEASEPVITRSQVETEKTRVYAPIARKSGMEWKELAAGIARIMQDYCGDVKNEESLKIGLKWFEELKAGEASTLYARNPHELMRSLECLSLITLGEMVMHASLVRKASSTWLGFQRSDYPELDPPEWNKWITTKLENGKVQTRELPMDFWLQPPYAPTYKENYEAHHEVMNRNKAGVLE